MKTNIRTTAAARRPADHRGKLLAVAAAVVALQASSASATVLDWSYTGPSGNNGSGTFDATLQLDGSYSLDGINGTANGAAITGLDSLYGPDNLVFPPSPPNIGVDRLGISFDAGGVQYALYEDDGGYAPSSLFYCGAVYCLLTGTATSATALTSFSVSVASVPEPAAWAMMVLGLGGLGAALRSRRRPVAVTA